MLADQTHLYKHFNENPNFKKRLTETVFSVTCPESAVA